MRFKYIASQPDGKIIEGETDLKDKSEVLGFLASRGLRPVSVRSLERGARRNLGIGLGKDRITITDQIFLTKNLALMLKIGVGLLQAINILIEDFEKPAMKTLLVEVKNGVEKGQPFYATFARYPKIFSQSFINLIKAGESSGNLERVFDNLSAALTKEKALKDQIKSVLIYPIILVVTSLLVLIFLVTFAIPKIARLFLDSGFNPPFFSKIVFTIGLFFGHYGFYILGVVTVLIIGFLYVYRLSYTFKQLASGFVSELPIVRKVVSKIALQNFCATFASLIKAGMPFTEALEITASTASNSELKATLIRISREGLSKGLTVGEAFRREIFFPRMVVDLIAISEKAGHIEEVLTTLADFYAGEIDSSLKSLVSFLEPILLLVVGAIIGIIALSIIVPIYQLTTQFGQ